MSTGEDMGDGIGGGDGGLLEKRYRALLRVLPKPYREARGEELLSTLMEGAPEGRTRPDPREVLSLLTLGVRARLGATDGVPAGPQIGATARAVAIVGTLVLALVAVTQMTIWAHGILTWPPARWTWGDPLMLHSPVAGGFSAGGYELPTVWLVVLALLAVGWWRAARVLALVVFLVSAWLTSGTAMAMVEQTLLAGVVTAALFAARGVHARPVRVAGPAGVAAVLGMAGWVYVRPMPPPLEALDALQAWGGTSSIGALVATTAVVAGGCVLMYRKAAWSVGVAVVALAALAPIIVRARVHQGFVGSDLSALAALFCALVVIAGAVAVRARLSARGERPTPVS